MAIIDSAGLFLGDRLAWCSDLAQLHWPRLYSAANNYARLELNYNKIAMKAYANFKKPPTEIQFWEWIKEYRDNYLLLVYQDENGSLWGQWQTNERYLLGYKNADDKRSPPPPVEAQEKYRQAYIFKKTSKSISKDRVADLCGVVESCLELSGLSGVGVGVGEGVGEGEKQKLAPTASAVPASPAFITFPLLESKTHIVTESDVKGYELAYPAVNVRAELRKIIPWLDAHPEKLSVGISGSKQRIVKWLTRTQNQGGNGVNRGNVPESKWDRARRAIENEVDEDPADDDGGTTRSPAPLQ